MVEDVRVFRAKEFVTDSQFIPRTLTVGGPGGKELDLFEDLVTEDGRVEIWLRCAQPAQYFGAARADLYLRARNASFVLNFAKGYLGIWLQMLLVTGFGVMFSTFLSGPVAMLATAGTMLGGFFSSFMQKLAAGETYGGGPMESMIRLVTQDNVIQELEPGLSTDAAKMTDAVLQAGLGITATLLPAFGEFNYSSYVSHGFDISVDLMLVRSVTTLGFLLPVFVFGYFFLKTREIAR
jgi:hypothetical protein